MSRGSLACASLLLWSCTLTRPLESYSAGYGVADASVEASTPETPGAPDHPAPPDDEDAGDAGDGCGGDVTILDPKPDETVGATLHVSVSAPGCIRHMIVYIDEKATIHVDASTIDDQTFPIGIGTHHVNVNGWVNSDQPHTSPIITVVRKQ